MYRGCSYSFTPESNEAREGNVPCPMTQHRNNTPTLRGEKHDISLKILHQEGFETTRQATTLAMRHTLAIAPHSSLYMNKILYQCWSTVYDSGPKLVQHCVVVWCLLGVGCHVGPCGSVPRFGIQCVG